MAATHDMSTIETPLNLAVNAEYQRAAELHGHTFATLHDGFGVISEEVQEAKDCFGYIKLIVAQMLRAIREDNPRAIADNANHIRQHAVTGAAELIQVAAMCEKMLETVKEAL